MLRTDEFDYPLPEDLIAAVPARRRDASRLMVLDRKDGTLLHRDFSDICGFLGPGDLLVLNDTKVIPARIFGRKKNGGGRVEMVLLKDTGSDVWECLVQPARRLKKGYEIEIKKGRAVILEEIDDSRRLIKFEVDGGLEKNLGRIGQVPLPPYIVEKLNIRQKLFGRLKERYQTVYADKPGASAAPTAGLHFTAELLDKLRAKGVRIAYITLHTGVGTFRPVLSEYVEGHRMFTEQYEISEETSAEVRKAKEQKKRIVAVGTTVVRCLEDCYSKHGKIIPVKDEASIFIYPPFRFNVIDAMVTNFHFPKSTLLMMVSAFAGREFVMKAYLEAVKLRYRFFSFGDAMLIL